MTRDQIVAWAKANPDNPKAKKVLAASVADDKTVKGIASSWDPEHPPEPDPNAAQASKSLGKGLVKHGAGIALPVAGAALGAALPIPGAAAAGGAAGNVLAGMVGRYMDDKPVAQGQGMEMAKDAAWGAAPVAATRGVGRLLSGSRNTIKAAGQFLGEETPSVASRLGPEIGGVPSRDLAGVASMGAEGTAEDAMSFAGDLAKTHQKNLNGLLKQGFRNPEAINPEKIAANQLSTLSEGPPRGMVSQAAGIAGGAAGHAVAGYQGFHAARTLASSMSSSFSTPEQRFLKTLAEAYKRNLPLSPELEKMITNTIAPQAGQAAQAVPALTQGVREYMQRGQGE